ncbi:hypothetical protein HELRODRAFT_167761 [Helobdella robusta]|uniref:Uncharacterized protein n=1 Tax=Helobdella robusta TaxID=6412 RepID=T1EZR9_HELRO|nr:hypothetical protein HELRODRAFT_167761 [Helobdella robusta]ESO09935.1 hypothetical protein HELRODRAFT_167761 [Helobdella robusta]
MTKRKWKRTKTTMMIDNCVLVCLTYIYTCIAVELIGRNQLNRCPERPLKRAAHYQVLLHEKFSKLSTATAKTTFTATTSTQPTNLILKRPNDLHAFLPRMFQTGDLIEKIAPSDEQCDRRI